MEDKFDKLYAELYEESHQVLDDAKKQRNSKILKVILICVLINIIVALFDKEKVLVLVLIPLSALVGILILHREMVKYRKIFKSTIINKIVKKCSERLNYSPEGGISKFDYNMSNFDKGYDELSSEDRIYGTIGKDTSYQMAQLSTNEIKKERDADGNEKTYRTETFKGIYGIVKLEKPSGAKVYMANNSFTKRFSSKRIEMDSGEFEKEYDCLTEDKMTAMKIFTSDLLEKLVDFKKAKITAFEVKLEDNMVYFRSRCGEVFEPPNFKDAFQKDLIRKYYDIITLPVEFIEKMIENIEVL